MLLDDSIGLGATVLWGWGRREESGVVHVTRHLAVQIVVMLLISLVVTNNVS